MDLKPILFGLFGISLTLFSSSAHAHGQRTRWIVFYGERLPAQTLKALKALDLAILEPDHIDASELKKKAPKAKFIGYISLGEVNESRWYWPQLKGKDFVIEENPEWKGAHRIDIRSKEWQKLLLNEVIPSIFSKGYDGVFLDTIDTASYFEGKSEHYAGSKKALTDFVKEIKKRFPDKIILPNNGLPMLMDMADAVGGVVVEDLYTRYDFQKKKSLSTPIEERDEKEKILDLFREKTKKPVYNILYAKPFTALARFSIERSRQKGYTWYLTTVDLTGVGMTE